MERVPRHIAIILDGNRRFAKRLMMKPWMGHEWGAKKVIALLEWLNDFDVKELTLYTFSIQNFNRPKEEFDYIMSLAEKEFGEIISNKSGDINRNGIRINFIGRLGMFPQGVQDKMRTLMELTKNNKEHVVNFAMAYGGREEIIDATRKIAEQIKRGELDINGINEEVFAKNLYFSSEPDIIIRTGGERRTSNFLMFQAPYSEWFFLEKSWPEFEKEDLVKVMEEYESRERRFGK